jgi:hypothetical protein
MLTDRVLLTTDYAGFNARNIDAVLELTHPNVDWPNGMEGGRVHGHSEVRDYWTRQWSLIDPNVDPVGFETEEAGRTVVTVHQVVRDLDGKLLLDQTVKHVYLIEDGLIQSMEIVGEGS